MEQLLAQAEALGHRVLEYPFTRVPCLSVRDAQGRCTIGLDPRAIGSNADGRVFLAHELGHCETGAFYTRSAAPDARGRREERADRWAIRRLVPLPELIAALRRGETEPWQLAERFEVTEPFIRRALAYYTEAKGLRFSET